MMIDAIALAVGLLLEMFTGTPEPKRTEPVAVERCDSSARPDSCREEGAPAFSVTREVT